MISRGNNIQSSSSFVAVGDNNAWGHPKAQKSPGVHHLPERPAVSIQPCFVEHFLDPVHPNIVAGMGWSQEGLLWITVAVIIGGAD
jgi:hypothetical protein